jgi:hypothetical protein
MKRDYVQSMQGMLLILGIKVCVTCLGLYALLASVYTYYSVRYVLQSLCTTVCITCFGQFDASTKNYTLNFFRK